MRRKLCHVFTACAQLPKLSFSKLLPPCHFRHVWRSKRDVCGFSNRWFCVPPSCRWLPWLPGAKVKDCGEKTGGNGLLFYEFTDLGFSWILHNMVNTREYLLGSVHAVHNWLCFSLFQMHSNAFPSEYVHSKGCKRLSAPSHAWKQMHVCTHRHANIVL